MNKTATQIACFIGAQALLFPAAAMAAGPLGDDTMALGMLVVAPFALVAAYVVAQGIIGDRHFGAVMAVIYIFVAAAVFRTREFEDKSVDFQVAMKLAAFGVMFITDFVFFTFALGRFRLPRLFYIWLAFFFVLVVTSLYAVKVPFALISTVLFGVAFVYAVYMTVWLSRLTAVQIMMWAALLLCLGSIFTYYAIPSIGVMQGWTAEGGAGEIGRMKGITGSANGIGLIAAIGLVLPVLYFRSFGRFGKCTALVLIPSALACLVLSNNRSSMLAVIAALWFSFMSRKDIGFKVMVTATLGAIGVAALAIFPNEIFALLSRSGKVEEITTATGRTAIWSVVLEMWAQKPLYGYGYNSAIAILPLDPRLFHAAAHAHNMYLQLLFSGGVILLGLFLCALWLTFRQALRSGAINEAALLLVFMVRGMTEASPFSGMVGYGSIGFTLALALVIAPLVRTRAATAPVRPVAAARMSPALRRVRS